MREIKTEIHIDASPEKVWSVITDLNSWHEWNPIVKQVKGDAMLGAHLTVTMRGEDGKDANSYAPIITRFDEPSLLCWRGKMLAELLMTNDKIIKLEKTETGTRLIHRELFKGVIVPLFWNKMEAHVPTMLDSMNSALKAKVEKS